MSELQTAKAKTRMVIKREELTEHCRCGASRPHVGSPGSCIQGNGSQIHCKGIVSVLLAISSRYGVPFFWLAMCLPMAISIVPPVELFVAVLKVAGKRLLRVAQ